MLASLPKGGTRTFAEMSLDEKRALSPLGKLHAQLRAKLGL